MPSRAEHWRARARHLHGIPWRDKWLYGQTFVILGLARAAILIVGFDRLEGFMGERGVAGPADIDDDERAVAQRVARSLRRVSEHTPWTSNCFPQALAGVFLLRRRDVEPTVHLGARFSADARELEAHAWLRVGSFAVAGGDGSTYGELVAYSRPRS